MTSQTAEIPAIDYITDSLDLEKMKQRYAYTSQIDLIAGKIAQNIQTFKKNDQQGKGPYNLLDILIDSGNVLVQIADQKFNARSPIYEFLIQFEKAEFEAAKERAFITVEQLREKFCDEEIRSLAYDMPPGWEHSGPSFADMTNYTWIDKNFDNLIRLRGGLIALYFYKERKSRR